MRRSPALVPLSHDHQHALELALALRRATAPAAPDLADRATRWFADEGAHHFATEEELLLGALPRSVAGWASATTRVRSEHEEIRDRVGRLDRRRGTDLVPELHALGELLNDHVRFEERELFPTLEQHLDEATLAALGAAVAAAHG